MQRAISDRAAITFAGEMYAGLIGRRQPIDAAVERSCARPSSPTCRLPSGRRLSCTSAIRSLALFVFAARRDDPADVDRRRPHRRSRSPVPARLRSGATSPSAGGVAAGRDVTTDPIRPANSRRESRELITWSRAALARWSERSEPDMSDVRARVTRGLRRTVRLTAALAVLPMASVAAVPAAASGARVRAQFVAQGVVDFPTGTFQWRVTENTLVGDAEPTPAPDPVTFVVSSSGTVDIRGALLGPALDRRGGDAPAFSGASCRQPTSRTYWTLGDHQLGDGRHCHRQLVFGDPSATRGRAAGRHRCSG